MVLILIRIRRYFLNGNDASLVRYRKSIGSITLNSMYNPRSEHERFNYYFYV
jgi:hypothetical protein